MSSSFHGVLLDGVQVLMKLSFTVVGLYIGITLQKSIILKTDYAFGAAFPPNKNLDRSPLVDPKEALSISRLLHNFKCLKLIGLPMEWPVRLQTIILIIGLILF